MFKNLIFDMDDTLIPCGEFYRASTRGFREYQAQRLGIDEKVAEKMHSVIDLACIDLPNGFDRSRFPRSFEAASLALDVCLGRPLDLTAAGKSFDIGDSVFDAPYDLLPGVRELLWALKAGGYNLFLYTKGDPSVQQAKIDRNALSAMFPKQNIHIVSKKGSAVLAPILREHDMLEAETVVIGDSIRDDVGSADPLGVASIHVTDGHNTGWAFENVQIKPTYTIASILDLTEILPIEYYG